MVNLVVHFELLLGDRARTQWVSLNPYPMQIA